MQNVAVSVRGWQFHRDRYRGPSFSDTARTLEENERLSLEALQRLQFTMFREFAEHCFENSPYYHNLWKSRGVDPRDVRQASDVSLLPIVPKQDLRSRTEEFLTQKIHRGMTAVHTSGTTGSPLTVYFSREDIGRRYAFLDRCRRWAGVRVGDRRASFTGRNIIPQRQCGPPFWRYNAPGKQFLLSSYHLLAQNVPAYVEALAKFQPDIIDGYPSAIHIMADHILRAGSARPIHPRAILVSAETLLPHQRETMEAAFCAKVHNQYASSEGAPFVSECGLGRLHVHLDSGLVEVLDSNGNPTPPGQIGEIVVTSFTTRVLPLLRYAIGDAAIPSDGASPCPCGLPFPTVTAIVGRVDDFLYTPDRGLVGRLDTVFKGTPNSVVEAQIVQTSPDTIVVRIVPDRPRYRPEHARKIVQELRSKVGQFVAIEVEEVSVIPRSANGKMRPVVNLCLNVLPSAFQYGSKSDWAPSTVQTHHTSPAVTE